MTIVASPSSIPREPSAILSSEQMQDYHRDGYLIIRQVFSPLELMSAVLECDQLLARRELIDTANIRCRWQDHIVTKECLFECFDPVIDIGPICALLARDPRILNIVSAIYGEPAFLFKDKLIFKPPGAKGYDLHQDFIAWKNFPRSFTTVEIAIDPADCDNGCTEVFSGYHTRGCLSPEDGDYHSLPQNMVNPEEGVPLQLQPGDIAIFGAFTPHRSSPNRTNRWRRQLYLSYNSASDGGERREEHYREFHAWLKVKYAEYGKHNVWFR